MQYLIFLDIDDTLMSKDVVHPRTVAGIARARQAGHKVFLNTGRARSIVPESLMEAIQPDGTVCGIGAHVTVGGETLYSRTMDDARIESIMHFLGERSIRAMLEGENESVGFGGPDRLLRPDQVADSFEELKANFPDIRVHKFTVMRPLTEEEILLLGDDVVVFNHPLYSEIAIKGCTKASGIEIVRKALGYARESVIAMGDGSNDMDMLRTAGIAVAMGNATDEVKEISDFVSVPCNEGGVGYAIEKLIFEE